MAGHPIVLCHRAEDGWVRVSVWWEQAPPVDGPFRSSVWQDVAFLYLRRCALLQGQGGTCCAPGIPLSRSEGSHVSPTQRGLLRPTGVRRKAARSPGIGFNMFECWELGAHTVSSLAWVTREALPYSLLLLLQRILLSRECSARI